MDKAQLLKLLKSKLGTGQGEGDILGQINSMLPDIKQNEVIQGKTGFGGTAEVGIQQGLDMVLPGLGSVLGLTSKIGSAVEGDGSSVGRNLVEDVINPLSNINDLAEGRAKYAIPIVGSFLKARDVKNNMAFTADKQLGESINESKNLNTAYPTYGVNKVQRFEFGGSVPLSKDTDLLQGATHQQGGIPLMKEGQQIGEAENNELLINTGDNAHIATDKLINPKTNNSYAVDIGKIKQEQGKYEKLQEKRPADGTLKNVIDKNKKETEVLIQEQEMTKQQMLQALKQSMGQQPQQGMPKFAFGAMNVDTPEYLDFLKKQKCMGVDNMPVYEGSFKIGDPLAKAEQSSLLDLAEQRNITPNNNTNTTTSPKMGVDFSKIGNITDKINGVPADILTGLANAFDRKKDKAPQKDGLNYLSPLRVDYGAQKEQAIRTGESTLKALNNNISDATTSRAASLASLSERIGSVNNINEAETNTNMQLLQDVLGKNSQIQGLNNETKFSNEVLGQQFKDDKRAKNLQLASRIANESSQRKRDKNADELANQQNFLRAAIEEDPRVLQNALDSGIFDKLFTEEQRKKLLESLKVK